MIKLGNVDLCFNNLMIILIVVIILILILIFKPSFSLNNFVKKGNVDEN